MKKSNKQKNDLLKELIGDHSKQKSKAVVLLTLLDDSTQKDVSRKIISLAKEFVQRY